MKFLLFILTIFIFFNGCVVNSNPHQVFIDLRASYIGEKWNPKGLSLKNKNAGEVSSNVGSKVGDGLTHVTIDENGNRVYHIFKYEYLKGLKSFPFFTEDKSYIGKCLIYYVVDPKTNIILDWGFDKGGNPKTCRVTG